MASIGELFVALGFKVEEKGLNQFVKNLKDAKKKLLFIPIAAGAAAFAIERFAASAFNASVALQNFNMQTGLMGSRLRQFQVAGRLTDISLSADQVTSSIQNLQSNLTAIQRGGGNVKPFGMLGISTIGKDAFQVIEEMRQRIKGLSPALATSLISEAGLDPKFINVLRLTNKEFKELGGQFILSDKANAKLVKLGTSITKLKLSLVFLKDQFVAFIAKPLTGLANFLAIVIKKLTLVGESISDSIDAWKSLGRTIAEFFGDADIIFNTFLTAVGVLAAGLVIAFAPLTASLIAVLLLLEDIAVFNKGGDSLIGVGLDAIKAIPNALISAFDRVGESIQRNMIDPILDVLKKISNLTENNFVIKKLRQGFKSFDDFNFEAGKMLNNVINGLPAANNITQNNTFNIQANDINTGVEAAKRVQNNANTTLMQLNNGVVN